MHNQFINTWSKGEECRLRDMKGSTKVELLRAFPNRTWVAIKAKAYRLKMGGLVRRVPKIKINGSKTEEAFIAGLIEGEGSFFVHVSRNGGRNLNNEYRYNYLEPEFKIAMRDKTPMERVGNLLGLSTKWCKHREQWLLKVSRERALTLAKWILPLLTINSLRHKQTKAILKIFRKNNTLKVSPQVVINVLRMRKQKRLNYLLQHIGELRNV